jgi:hypothetical protein
MDVSVGSAVSAGTKGIIGTVVNALYAGTAVMKGISGRGVSVKSAGSMLKIQYITGNMISMAQSMLTEKERSVVKIAVKN